MESGSIVVLGSLHYDIYIQSKSIPKIGETVLADNWFPKLGGKGANLAEMCNLGLPVPHGFTISTEVCTYYYNNNKSLPEKLKLEIKKNLKKIENFNKMKFGSDSNPLLLSVRSGSRASMQV